MRRYILANITLALLFSNAAFAKDPCQSLICMMGKVQGGVSGNGSSKDGCGQAISDFESIIKTRHGHIDESATPIARRDYLNSCPGADSNASAINAIISKFGNTTL
ncbi:hypothetical protein WT34_24325 [Burkholderia stagnalis]|uniref:hypothetical protein n=1 Tax=Burkholderia stagnalis TaxID=1503054 RepID=UPI00075B8AF9|nr:hypothetical protein [Burkholderia stagnalis]KVX69105.1 hypothetical protein WT34_24325 [Burkholderia stagnalis]